MSENAIVPFQPQPISFPLPMDKIKKWHDEYMPLKVNGIEDKMGLAAVHCARMAVKEARCEVEKRRKELKADALKYGKQVDTAAKELFEALKPIEQHLYDEENAVEREKQRLADEEAARKKAAWEAKMQARIDALKEHDVVLLTSVLEAMSDEEFETRLADAKEKRAAALEELRRAEEARRAEEERLAKERAELERQRKEQEAREAEERAKLEAQRKEEEAKQAAERAKLEEERRRQEEERQKLAAEKQRIEVEEAERKRVAELEAERKRAAEEARLEAIEEQKRAEREAKERAEAEERERKRLEALRPDREKLVNIAEAVRAIGLPEVSDAADAAAERIRELLEDCARDIETVAQSLVKAELQTA